MRERELLTSVGYCIILVGTYISSLPDDLSIAKLLLALVRIQDNRLEKMLFRSSYALFRDNLLSCLLFTAQFFFTGGGPCIYMRLYVKPNKKSLYNLCL